MRAIRLAVLLGVSTAVAVGLSACAMWGSGTGAPSLAAADTSRVYDSTVSLWFDRDAGDRQRMVKGTCPGAGCEVGPMVSLEPVEDSHSRGSRPGEILARVINHDSIPWTDTGLTLAPHDTLYLEIHATSDTVCTARYWKKAFYAGGMVDSAAAGPAAGCTIDHSGPKWKRGVARWRVGSIAAWLSCSRGCCRAA